MIKVLYSDWSYNPVLVCDACGKQIESVGDGIAVTRLGTEQNTFLEVIHVHKVPCDEHYSSQILGDPETNSREIMDHLIALMQHSGVSAEAIIDRLGIEDKAGGLGRC